MNSEGEVLQKIMEDSGMRPVVVTIPEAVINMAKEGADELGISVSSWLCAAAQIIYSGQKQSPEIKGTVHEQGVTIELAHKLSSIMQEVIHKEEEKGR